MQNILELLSAINYWERPPAFNTGFIRERYCNIILNSAGNKLIKVIVGQRRSGKSYVIRQVIDRLIHEHHVDGKNVFYLNKEMFEFESIRTAHDLSALIKSFEKKYRPGGKIYIFIDEIQTIRDWEKLIVSLAQHPVDDYEIFITGSNSELLSGELATRLSGRYLLTEIFPFSYKEFLNYHDLKNSKEHFIQYINTTGMPEVYHLNNSDTITHYFQSLKNTILLKDIMFRHKIRDYVLLEDIFLFLIHNVGNMTSIPSIIKYFKSRNRKADYTTITQYISYMEDTFMIHEAPRFSLKTREVLSGNKKYFVNDLGFRNYLFPHLIKDVGAVLENVTFLHLRMAGYQITLGYGSNFEVDFFAEKDRDKRYVQTTYMMPEQSTAEREFGALEKIRDNLPKYVVSMDDMLICNEKGIIHQHIWNFIYDLVP